ncbi:hypothetical protein KKB07_05820 [bacterium]|nr:hypothetical protein [bacterium]
MLWIMDSSGWSIKNENLLLGDTKHGDEDIKVCWYYKKGEYIFGVS